MVPLPELLAAAVRRLGAGRTPAVVWLCDPLDQKANREIAAALDDEQLGLALGRLVCLRVEAGRELDPRAEREILRRAPALWLYDPSGQWTGTLEGRRTTSRAGIAAKVGKLWAKCFTLPLREYVRQMDDILDRTEKLERQRLALRRKKDRAGDRPAKLTALKAEAKHLDAEAAKISADEMKVRDACGLRERFLKVGADPLLQPR